MAAILMLDDDQVRAACAEAAGEVQAVNFNAPGQVVIAGEKAAVERAIEAVQGEGRKRAMPLPVSAPFHSSLMKPAAEKLEPYLRSVALGPQISVINNVDVAIAASRQGSRMRSCGRRPRPCAGSRRSRRCARWA
jgi:[acyl-carrier-protein] S-malonyltransferase